MAATLPLDQEEPGQRVLTRAERQQRQVAARRHGLFARAAPNLRSRTIRVGYLVQRAYLELPDLDRRDEATVRAWARAECRSVDCYARLESDPVNDKLSDQWRQAEELARKLRGELFLTPSARLMAARLSKDVRDEEITAGALARLRENHAADLARETVNGRGRLAATEVAE